MLVWGQNSRLEGIGTLWYALFRSYFNWFLPSLILSVYNFNKCVIYGCCSFLSLNNVVEGPSWSWSYSSWIYHFLCKQYLSPLKCEFESHSGDTTLCDKVCQWLTTGRWFPLGPPLSSTNKTDRHDIAEIVLKVALNTINPSPCYALLTYKRFMC